jgi:hypothetical protein
MNIDIKKKKKKSIAFEYLLERKEHPALTYKLGDEVMNAENFKLTSQNNFEVLEKCELSYLRVISTQLCKILLPESEWDSKISRSLCIEVLAGCVLLPTMDLLSSAEYLNQLIVDSLTDNNKAETSEEGTNNVDPKLVKENFNKEKDQVNISVSSSNASKDSFKESESIADQWIMPISQQDESDLSRRAVILPMLTLAVIEVQNIVSMGSIEDKQWDAPECRSAVCQLVLAIEAALQHGTSSKDGDNSKNLITSRYHLEHTLVELTVSHYIIFELFFSSNFHFKFYRRI